MRTLRFVCAVWLLSWSLIVQPRVGMAQGDPLNLPHQHVNLIQCLFPVVTDGLGVEVHLSTQADQNRYSFSIWGKLNCLTPNLAADPRTPVTNGTFTLTLNPVLQGPLASTDQVKMRNEMFWRCYEQALLYRANPLKNMLEIKVSPGDYSSLPLPGDRGSILVYAESGSYIECNISSAIPPL